MKYTFGTLLSRDFWIAQPCFSTLLTIFCLKKKKTLYKVSHPQEQEISNEIDNANTPQEFSNLHLAYVWNLIAWNYTSISLFVREYKSLDSIEIKI